MNSNLTKKIVTIGALIVMCFSTSVHAENTPLAKQKCIPCSYAVPALKGDILITLQEELDSEWEIVDEQYLQREFLFEDFGSALEFTVALGAIAEEEGHHPDIQLSYGRVLVLIWTHKSQGLTESDFILAALIDAYLKGN